MGDEKFLVTKFKVSVANGAYRPDSIKIFYAQSVTRSHISSLNPIKK